MNNLFPSFFLAGFECSTHVNQRGERQDLVKITQHDRFLCEDYQRVASLAMGAVREGVPWYRIDRKGRYDFRPVAPYIEAAQDFGLTGIWDLFHYGFPTYLNPFSDEFVLRFADYCYAFARYLVRKTGEAGARFYTPVNEISYYAWAGGEVGWFAPFERGRGLDFKIQLVRAALAGIDAIRSADPGARIVNVDPFIHTVPPDDEPELAEDSERFNSYQWQAFDMLSGLGEWAHLGGGPQYLDIVGVNHYLHGQWEHCRSGSLAFDDPRRKPFGKILEDVGRRYAGHPIIISETSCFGHMRPIWLDYIVDESIKAMQAGVDLQGICLYPIIDMPDWHVGTYIEYGMWDLVPDGPEMQRRLYRPYREALVRARRRLAESGLVPSLAVETRDNRVAAAA
jgi:beta-glucosidase/6-phospho-beta-glucosidase/beta-galactosidase